MGLFLGATVLSAADGPNVKVNHKNACKLSRERATLNI